MSEAALTRACVERLKKMRAAWRAVKWLKIHGGPMQAAGWPDLLVVIEGRVLFVELKGPDGRLTKLQAVMLTDLKQAVATVGVCRSVEEFLWMIENPA